MRETITLEGTPEAIKRMKKAVEAIREEDSMRKLLEVLRNGKPEDVFKQETLTMIYADGFKAGAIAEGNRQKLKEVTA